MAKKKAAQPKEPPSRRGRVKPGKKGEPAQFQPGSAAPSQAFDPGQVCEELKLWWENDGGDQFVVQVSDELWSKWPVASIKQLARMLPNRMIALKQREGERLSEMDRVLLHARQYRCVEKVLPALAGYRAGIRELQDGRKVVVKSSPRLIEPVAGDWSLIKELIEGRLKLDGGTDQSAFFHAWCRVAYESLRYGEPGSYKPGHALVLAGAVGSGKSRLQIQIVTPLLGGRTADPTAFLGGEDSFNADMMGAEHLMMEELLTGSQRTVDRVALSESIKRLIANESKRMRLMRVDPLSVDPFWRFTLSMNNDPDKLRAFPMLTPDFRDKVLMLLVQSRPLPMPTETVQEQKAYNDAVREQLPAYAHWLLNEFTITPELKTEVWSGRTQTRFGFAGWQHPDLAADLFDDTPAAQLLRLLDDATFDEDVGPNGRKLWELEHPYNCSGRRGRDGEWKHQEGVWRGGADDLERMLLGEISGLKCSVEKSAVKLLRHASLGRLMSRLREDRIDRVDQDRTNARRLWMICAPPRA
jgi:hypothetical protein